MAYNYVCDNCEKQVDPDEVIEMNIANAKTGEHTTTHACHPCFDLAVEGDGDVTSNLLLG